MHGHTDDSIIAILDNKSIFSGDTILSIPTITRLPSGSTKDFWLKDIPFLNSLGGIETVYPGHGLPGKLEDMLAVNIMPERIKKYIKG